MISILEIFKLACNKQASDVHITTGSPPVLRIDGILYPLDTKPLTSEQTKTLCYSVISDEQKSKFETEKTLEFSFFVKDLLRFRGTLFFQKSAVVGTFRLLHVKPPNVQNLGLPPSVESTIHYPNGLVLVTGPTGSGKSTTMAGIIDAINENRRGHILTLEDPIEIIHAHKKCIVNQREIGVDCHSFSDGVRSALRLDPDICFVGEMRDLDTISMSLRLAETGHLVFSTLHTNSASKTIDRIISAFPQSDRSMVGGQLSTVLQAVISQRLIPAKKGGRKVVAEVMFATPAIRNLIREGKYFQIYSIIQTSYSEGMTTMNNSLINLIKSGEVSSKDAFHISSEKNELHQLLKQQKIVS